MTAPVLGPPPPPANLDEALAVFQADPPILRKDKAGHQSKYADLVQVNATVLARLNQLGVVWKTKPTLTADGARFVLAYELLHVASGTREVGEWPLKLSDNPQQMGSAVTYGRRYALLAVTGVAAEDEDDDGQGAAGRRTAQRATPRTRQAAPATPVGDRLMRQHTTRPPLPGESPDDPAEDTQVRHMYALWRDLGMGGEDKRDRRLQLIREWLGLEALDSSKGLTRGQVATVIKHLSAKREQMREPAPA